MLSLHSFLSKLAIVSALLLGTSGSPIVAQELRFEDRKAFEEAVRSYLLKNPDVVIEAIGEFQRRESVATKLPKVEIYRGYLENGTTHAVLGNPNGDITMVEFFDYRCGYCKKYFKTMQQVLRENSNVRMLAIQYPILDRPGKPRISRTAARAGIAANMQGKFAAFHTAMMSFKGSLSEDHIYRMAEQVGLDLSKLKADMNSKLVDKQITNNLSIGAEIGFRGTPAYIIGKDIVEGAAGIDAIRKSLKLAADARASAR